MFFLYNIKEEYNFGRKMRKIKVSKVQRKRRYLWSFKGNQIGYTPRPAGKNDMILSRSLSINMKKKKKKKKSG